MHPSDRQSMRQALCHRCGIHTNTPLPRRVARFLFLCVIFLESPASSVTSIADHGGGCQVSVSPTDDATANILLACFTDLAVSRRWVVTDDASIIEQLGIPVRHLSRLCLIDIGHEFLWREKEFRHGLLIGHHIPCFFPHGYGLRAHRTVFVESDGKRAGSV